MANADQKGTAHKHLPWKISAQIPIMFSDIPPSIQILYLVATAVKVIPL
jgi:hypothetical protein